MPCATFVCHVGGRPACWMAYAAAHTAAGVGTRGLLTHHVRWILSCETWKYDGSCDSFKELIDMTTVHSSCRVCVHIAMKIHEKEERTAKFSNRLCSWSSKRGMICKYRDPLSKIRSINHRSFGVLRAKFGSLNHVPVWKDERPSSI